VAGKVCQALERGGVVGSAGNCGWVAVRDGQSGARAERSGGGGGDQWIVIVTSCDSV